MCTHLFATRGFSSWHFLCKCSEFVMSWEADPQASSYRIIRHYLSHSFTCSSFSRISVDLIPIPNSFITFPLLLIVTKPRYYKDWTNVQQATFIFYITNLTELKRRTDVIIFFFHILLKYKIRETSKYCSPQGLEGGWVFDILRETKNVFLLKVNSPSCM